MTPLRCAFLGRVPYEEATRLQGRLVDLVRRGETGDLLLLLTHPPVITLGRGARVENVVIPDDGAEGKLNWTIQVGRQSRIFEELAFSHRFRPGQYLMVSCLPTRKDSLGARFFTRMKDGETIQRVLLIQATPSRDALAARADDERVQQLRRGQSVRVRGTLKDVSVSGSATWITLTDVVIEPM